MAEVSIDLNMVRVTNDIFVNKAEACAPELLKDSSSPGCYRRHRENRGYLSESSESR